MNFPFSDFRADEKKRWRQPKNAAPPPAVEAEPVSAAFPPPRPVSEEAALLKAGLAPSTLARIAGLSRSWGTPLVETALSVGAVRPQSYLRALARLCGLDLQQARETIRIRKISPAPDPYRLLDGGHPAPLDSPRRGLGVNANSAAPEEVHQLAAALQNGRDRICLVTRSTLSAALRNAYSEELTARASSGLWQRNPRMSAATGLVRWQIAVLATLVGLFVGAAIVIHKEALLVYSAALSVIFFITIALRFGAAAYAGFHCLPHKGRRYRRIGDSELPRYTVLVAMFREAAIMPQLVAGLRAIDYPAAKLDIKLVLEEIDHETIAAAHAMKLPPCFEVIIVPAGAPQTKPRALNYALQFARGDLLVIYDAEDRPDRFQLRKAVAHFEEASPEVVCLQGRLTFDNASENWLAKQFTIEYASLFGGILPMLDKTHLPIPLGGTSNHFRVDVLRRLGAWDPHNVTEDADLGMRIYRAGLRAEVLQSVTYEEAACQPGNWLKQRTRWLKGWMQTYCVHMRQPQRLLRELGMPGFIAFQGQFAGVVLAALVHPWSYVLIAQDLATGHLFSQPASILDAPILVIALVNLVLGYTASMALGFFVLQRRDVRILIPQLLFIPLYWLFISAAAYRALYQLVTAPHYWEKTQHGLTSVKRG